VAIGIVHHEGRILVARRKKGFFLGGYWEFPGGKREPLESYAQCVVRELREETGIEVRIVRELLPVRHDYRRKRVVLQPYLCALVSGEARPLASEEVRWVTPEELTRLKVPPASVPLVERIVSGLDLATGEPGPRDPV
jgi:mutator protein MutT